ncbi:MAG: choice-of-anchor U domain-containing protein [Comamonas sp.]
MIKTLPPVLALCAALLAVPVQAQTQTTFSEGFGSAPPGGMCPTALPAGWVQFNGDGLAVQTIPGIHWPVDNPGWAIKPAVSDLGIYNDIFPDAPNCVAMSVSRHTVSPGQADDWLASPQITVPGAGAKLRFRTRWSDGFELRWVQPGQTGSIAALQAHSTVLLAVPPVDEGEVPSMREVDLGSVAGQSGHLAFRNNTTDGWMLVLDDVWVGVPVGEYAIATDVTTYGGGTGGDLVCPSSVAPGGMAECTAVPRAGYTFHYGRGIGGCTEAGDILQTNNNVCTMSNVQGPRLLTGTFTPDMPPPTAITAVPDGAGNITIGWTPPDTALDIWQYSVGLIQLPMSSWPEGISANCPENAPFPGPYLVTSCTLAGYQANQLYGLTLLVQDGWGFRGHAAQLGGHQVVQIASVIQPAGLVTLRSTGAQGTGPDDVCQLAGPPQVLPPDSAALAANGAPAGATNPLGALRVQGSACTGPGQDIEVAITYPPGALAGLPPQARPYALDNAAAGATWQARGSISGDTINYTLSGNRAGAIDATLAPLAVPPTYTIGGSVSGLAGDGLVLQNNGGDDRLVGANGPFVFAAPVADGGSYAVTVKTPPRGQTCTVTGGSGTATANVISVQVACSAATYAVTALPAGFMVCTSNAVAYLGTVTCHARPPAGQVTQSISGCNGTPTGVGDNDYTTAPITSACTITATFAPLPTHTLGGTATGLTAGDLVLRNGSETLPVTANGSFSFVNTVADGGSYAVTIATQPGGQRCTIANASGSNVEADVGNVQVACTPYFEGTTVPASGAGGTGSATFSGGGPACRFDLGATAFEAAPTPPPPGRTLPQGVLRIKLVGCDQGAAVAMAVTWPEPVAGYTKHGLESRTATQPSYFAPAGLVLSGHTATFTVTDGAQGDDDWAANGDIADPAGPTALVSNPGGVQPTPVPTLGVAALALLGALLGLLALRRRA